MREFAAQYEWVGYLATFVALIISIESADPEKVLARMPYALRVFGVDIFAIALWLAGFYAGFYNDGPSGAIAGLIVMTISYGFVGLWSVHRIQDIGWSRWCNLLMLVPLLGQVWFFILLLMPGAELPRGAVPPRGISRAPGRPIRST